MTYEVLRDKLQASDWRVEAIDDRDGSAEIAIFSGRDAEGRAKDYADWMRRRVLMKAVQPCSGSGGTTAATP